MLLILYCSAVRSTEVPQEQDAPDSG